MYNLIYKNTIQGNISKYKEFQSEKLMNEYIEYFKNVIQVIEIYKTY